MQGLTLKGYHCFGEIHFTAILDLIIARLNIKSSQSHSSTKSRSRVPVYKCVHEEYVEDNYYARFDTHSYHHFGEIHFNAKLDVNNDRLDVNS